MDKPATTSSPIAPMLANRWSPISFDPSRELTAAELAALAEAARWAPSCFGAEPWGFVLSPRQDADAWAAALACLAEPNQAWARNASVLVCVASRRDFEHNGNPNRHHLYDAGAAGMSLVLQAEALGLRAHQMGGFDAVQAQETFAVPTGHEVITMIAVGQQAELDALPEGKPREREGAPRRRKDLGEAFFRGKWGTALA